MMKEVVDARGLSCPMPVIRARKAVQDGVFPVTVLVDSQAARENVTRAMEMAGLRVEATEEGDAFRLTITPGTETA